MAEMVNLLCDSRFNKDGESVMRFRNTHKGFGLIELMIAITLGLLLSTVVIQVFLASNQSSRVQDSLGRVQENARFAMQFIGKEVRMSGYIGCGALASIGVNNVALPSADVDYSIATALVGENNVASSHALGPVAGTDILHIKRASDEFIRVTGALTLSAAHIPVEDNTVGFAASDFVLVSDCTSADVFRISNTPKAAGTGNTVFAHVAGTLNSSGTLTQLYGADSEVYGFEATDFFVRDTGRDTESGLPINALYFRQRNIGSAGAMSAATELVEGVENMQLSYGVDNDDDRDVDVYQTADAVADWTNVLSVKVELRMAANEENVVGRTGTVSAQVEVDVLGNAIANNDGRYRKVFTNVFAVRNKLP